ncbi:MAG: hypothetical protein K9N23_18115, partial [Akkermansiaceae bacterium]|nr:hypothetical protein [Akkermansiaceae bacterium]
MKTACNSTILASLAAVLLLGPAAAAAPAAQPAATPAGNVLLTVGTTFSNGGGDQVYLLWTPTDEDLLRLRAYSIWSKPGAADSPQEYQPESWIKVQTDPAVIELTLRRAERLGQDLSTLDSAIDGLFELFKPGGTMNRAEKLSAILQGAQVEPDLYHDLLVLARFHPAVSLCLGAAYTAPISGQRTYEVRMAGIGDGPQAPDAARRVVGRVTLDPAAYQALPAPGPPVSTPFGSWEPTSLPTVFYFQPDSRSDLTARIRWATPDALRQKTLLQFGYHVYRVNPQFYLSQNLGGGTLKPGDLAAYAQAVPDQVKRVSRLPVMIPRMLTATEAADRRGDPDTAFFVDDNGRFDPGGVPFQDGDSFQYLVTAVDVLGRDGVASPATEILIYRTTGPNQPREVSVLDAVSHPTPTTTRQVFGIHWRSPVPVPDITVSHYDVYRWENVADITQPERTEGKPPVKVATIPAQPGVEWYAAEDASLGAALHPVQRGVTYWFTVRAVAVGALADLGPLPGAPASDHSAPASAILRDRSSPAPPAAADTEIRVYTSNPSVKVDSTDGTEALDAPEAGFLNGRITLTRTSAATDGADYYYRLNNINPAGTTEPTPLGPAPLGAVYLGSVRFADSGPNTLTTDLRVELPDATGNHSVTFHLRSRDQHGNLSQFTSGTLQATPATSGQRKLLTATAAHQYSWGKPSSGPTLDLHVSRPLDHTGIVAPQFQIETAGVQDKWKIHRRVDLGPLELVRAGFGGGLMYDDQAIAVNAGEMAYFIQTVDDNGTGSPLADMGSFRMSSIEPPPRPMLLPVEALSASRATLTWACSPHGVTRFHLGVAAVGRLAADTISATLSPAFETRSKVPVMIDGKSTTLDFRMYDTGTLPPNPGPQFPVTLDLEDGVTYHFIVEAISASGERSKASNLVTFAWVNAAPPRQPRRPMARPPARPAQHRIRHPGSIQVRHCGGDHSECHH